MEFFNESDIEGTNPEEGVTESSEEVGQDQDQKDQSNEAEAASEEPTLENQLDQLEAQGEDAADLVSRLNELGVIHNGLPAQIKDEDHARQLLSQGLDYTYKTQQLADERKTQEAEFEARAKELDSKQAEFEEYKQNVNNDLIGSEVMYQVLEDFKRTDPDLHADIVNAFQQRLSMYQGQLNNPQLSQFEKKIGELESKLGQYENGQVDSEVEKINQEWNDGIASVQREYASKLRQLKVVPQWDKVKEHWYSNKGNISPKQAFLSVHADLLDKALKTFNATNKVVNRSNSRLGPENSGTQTVERKSDSSSLMSVLENAADAVGFR